MTLDDLQHCNRGFIDIFAISVYDTFSWANYAEVTIEIDQDNYNLHIIFLALNVDFNSPVQVSTP